MSNFKSEKSYLASSDDENAEIDLPLPFKRTREQRVEDQSKVL